MTFIWILQSQTKDSPYVKLTCPLCPDASHATKEKPFCEALFYGYHFPTSLLNFELTPNIARQVDARSRIPVSPLSLTFPLER